MIVNDKNFLKSKLIGKLKERHTEEKKKENTGNLD